MKRWIVAVSALIAGAAVSTTLLVFSNPSRGAAEFVVAAQDIASGAVIAQSDVAVTQVGSNDVSTLVAARDEGSLTGMHATHSLIAGQLIQRSDVVAPGSVADSRLVFVPVKNVPAAPPGSHVDILVIGGQPEHPTVEPFAVDVEVAATNSAGLVVAVPAAKAAAFVYAGAAMQLAAVVAEPGASNAPEIPVSNDVQAMDIAGAAPS